MGHGPDPSALLVADAVLGPVERRPRLEVVVHGLHQRAEVLGMDDIGPELSHLGGLLGVEAEDLAPLGAVVDFLGGDVPFPDAGVGGGQGHFEAALALSQLLGLALLADGLLEILDHAEEAVEVFRLGPVAKVGQADHQLELAQREYRQGQLVAEDDHSPRLQLHAGFLIPRHGPAQQKGILPKRRAVEDLAQADLLALVEHGQVVHVVDLGVLLRVEVAQHAMLGLEGFGQDAHEKDVPLLELHRAEDGRELAYLVEERDPAHGVELLLGAGQQPGQDQLAQGAIPRPRVGHAFRRAFRAQQHRRAGGQPRLARARQRQLGQLVPGQGPALSPQQHRRREKADLHHAVVQVRRSLLGQVNGSLPEVSVLAFVAGLEALQHQLPQAPPVAHAVEAREGRAFEGQQVAVVVQQQHVLRVADLRPALLAGPEALLRHARQAAQVRAVDQVEVAALELEVQQGGPGRRRGMGGRRLWR